MAMLELRISLPTAASDEVMTILQASDAVGTLSRFPGASVRPEGDVIVAHVAREGADALVSTLVARELHHEGGIALQPIQAGASRLDCRAEHDAPGSGSDAMVWLDVTQRAYDDSELNWTFLAFMVLATLIAGVGIILDSTVLIAGPWSSARSSAPSLRGLLRRRTTVARSAHPRPVDATVGVRTALTTLRTCSATSDPLGPSPNRPSCASTTAKRRCRSTRCRWP
ncbi:hypothetical protein [Propioniciclava tarda]|uniref:Uncharacterized protein n=1 Tax=Propioniciclava tarda TaxID=433330 RepID=A0A4V2JT42_PROTD|nr:hypothetical protein [Propioniciclava tarda]TBT94831.1 hypothetical protein ET996_08575 [Propioniciclava tarda]